ncbi:HpcH/HpaI aldolase/citrate lyase family protein [Streptomyces sp. NPDC091292]|uniref:HpcH/HpaI aldolase/citrate lyase family protein n=1 Tax=Streptomyces sp. NPDC091292 TaxID=3365991 RepID=UPI00380216BE
MTDPSTVARTPLTWLYAPGDRPDVVAKALVAGADVVVIDLEDAVAPDRKEYARAATAERLTAPQPLPVHVRVNAVDGPLAAVDLAAMAGLAGVSGLRLPKVTRPAQVRTVARQYAPVPQGWAGADPRTGECCGPGDGAGTPEVPALHPLLESALGIEQAFAIAEAHPAVRGLALGEADLRADLGVREDSALDWARGRVVVAARAAGLAAPPQSVFPDVRDLDGLAASCARGRALGFFGRMAIHPRQLPVIAKAFLPSDEEVARAREVLAAAAGNEGAQALPNGHFIDAAVVRAAHHTLTTADPAC